MKASKGKLVLVVDDQPIVAISLKMLLEFEGYDVETAQSGQEALAAFQPQKFGVVFVDFEMPGMNGHELASIIKARDPRQPVVMITAYGDMVLAMQPPPQVDMILGKPWTADEIRNVFDKLLPAS